MDCFVARAPRNDAGYESAISPRDFFRARYIFVVTLEARAWERRALDAPATTYAQNKNNGRSLYRYTRTPGAPHAMGLQLLRALPGDRAFLPPSPCGLTAMSAPGRADVASARLDTSVEVPEPHDLAVRRNAVRQPAADRSRACPPALPSRVRPDAACVHHIPVPRS